MTELVPFDLNVHLEEYIQMNIEYQTWISDQFKEHYQIDTVSMVGPVQEYVMDHLEPFISMKPPGGVLYILKVDEKIAGMGAIKKLGESVGEVKRMWVRPEFRGRGLGKEMMRRLLDTGTEFGCSSFLLDSAKFMHAAHHIYRSAGFRDRGEYPESEPPKILRAHYIYMEK